MKLFTIGYSGYEREAFVRELYAHGIDRVIDVRSLSASRYWPEYDRAAIEKYLFSNGIEYCHMPHEFGARQENRQFLDAEGRVDFVLFAQSEMFGRGVFTVETWTGQGSVCALMCAEKDAINCHRAVLIGRRFHEMGWTVVHLSSEKEEDHQELEARLLDEYFPDRLQTSLLEEAKTDEELLNEAYRLQNLKIGFRKDE